MPWRIETDLGVVEPRSLLSITNDVDRRIRSGELSSLQPTPTGFDMLDRHIGGGMRPGELILLGGMQGAGKTTFCLQAARNVAASGRANVLYVCFEHDEEYILSRLISQESVDPSTDRPSGIRVRDLQAGIIEARRNQPVGLRDVLSGDERGRRALARLDTYANRLFILKASGYRTTVGALYRLVQQYQERSNDRLVVFVDYLQKIPWIPDAGDEVEKITRVTEALKELAHSRGVIVVAIVAADKEGLKAPRLRIHHLRGSSALTYEADIVILMNEKYKIVSKVHIEFNLHKAQAMHDWVVFSLEKNRAGRDLIDMQFQKRFEYCCFNPQGGDVTEKLIDDRVITE